MTDESDASPTPPAGNAGAEPAGALQAALRKLRVRAIGVMGRCSDRAIIREEISKGTLLEAAKMIEDLVLALDPNEPITPTPAEPPVSPAGGEALAGLSAAARAWVEAEEQEKREEAVAEGCTKAIQAITCEPGGSAELLQAALKQNSEQHDRVMRALKLRLCAEEKAKEALRAYAALLPAASRPDEQGERVVDLKAKVLAVLHQHVSVYDSNLYGASVTGLDEAADALVALVALVESRSRDPGPKTRATLVNTGTPSVVSPNSGD